MNGQVNLGKDTERDRGRQDTGRDRGLYTERDRGLIQTSVSLCSALFEREVDSDGVVHRVADG